MERGLDPTCVGLHQQLARREVRAMLRALLAEWRNWQTRRIQNPVSSEVRVRVPPRLPKAIHSGSPFGLMTTRCSATAAWIATSLWIQTLHTARHVVRHADIPSEEHLFREGWVRAGYEVAELTVWWRGHLSLGCGRGHCSVFGPDQLAIGVVQPLFD